jgi:deazaflavin-dependent oxidoreductase (nitroreductase family)
VNLRLPRALAEFNRRVSNPIQARWAGRLPPWAIIEHTGRVSGRTYRTPVLAALRDDRIYVAILYGEESDWVRNLLAGGEAHVIRTFRRHRLVEPRVERRATGPVLVAELRRKADG